MASDVARFLLGTTAAICTTSAFIPQILKIRRSGGKDVSYGMLFLFFVGTALWLAYGIVIWAGAVIAANGTTIGLIVICIFVKWRCEHEARRREKLIARTLENSEREQSAVTSAD